MINIRHLFLGAFLILSFEAKSEDFLSGTLLLHTLDWLQTREISKNDDYLEENFILGEAPSLKAVNTYFLVSAIVLIKINYSLPKKYRKKFNIFYISLSSTYVFNNFSIGVRF